MVDTDDDDYYFILVNNYINGHQGFDFVLSITEDPQPPDNNALVASQPVYEGDMVEGTTAGVTLKYGLVGMTCGLKITAPGVWYDFMGTGTQVEFHCMTTLVCMPLTLMPESASFVEPVLLLAYALVVL